MDYIKLNERLLKHNLKNKKRITLGLIVTYLITGGLNFVDEEVYARDIRRAKAVEKNNIKLDTGNNGTNMDKAANQTDVVNIAGAGSNGISHNKFIDFNVGSGNSVIFNNATQDVVSKTGGVVLGNKNLNGKAANAILNEVRGSSPSSINGTVEIAGQKADFILSNENGISINGGGFINANGVTLTTGKATIDNGNINLDVQKGTVKVEDGGVGTSGDYFNIVAKTIELKGQVAAFDGEKDADISLIAGKNKVNLGTGKALGDSDITYRDTSRENDPNVKYGIYADNLGSMYGKNIKMISTTEGLGVRHEGIVRSSGDFEINSNGDIIVGGVNVDKTFKATTKNGNFSAINGVYEADKEKYNFYIRGGEGIELNIDGDITLENRLETNTSEESKIKISAKNMKVVGNKKGTSSIISYGSLSIKVEGDLTIEALLVPVIKNGDTNKGLVVIKDKDGNIQVTDSKGNVLQEGVDYEWSGETVISSRNTDINVGGNFTNSAQIKGIATGTGDITIKTGKDFTNDRVIAATGNVTVDVGGNFTNKGENSVVEGGTLTINAENIDNEGYFKQAKSQFANIISVNVKDGTFTNSGIVSGYNVEIKGEGMIFENNGTVISGDTIYPSGTGSITISVKDITNTKSGVIKTGGFGLGNNKNNIKISAESLTNLGYLIALSGNVSIETIIKDKEKYNGDIVNLGEIRGDNVEIKGEGELTNYAIINAMDKVMIQVSNFLNAGYDPSSGNKISKLEQYLQDFYKLTSGTVSDAEKKLDDLKDWLETEKDPKQIEVLKSQISQFEKLIKNTKEINDSLAKMIFGSISGKNIEIETTGKDVNNDNSGIIKAEENLSMKLESQLENSGILESGKNLTIDSKSSIKNKRRIYAGKDLTIKAESFTSVKGDDAKDNFLEQFIEDKKAYNERLEETLNQANDVLKDLKDKNGKPLKVESYEDISLKIQELQNMIYSSSDVAQIEQYGQKIEALIKLGEGIADEKAKVSASKFGNLEAENITITTTGKAGINNSGLIITNGSGDNSGKLTLNSGDADIVNTGSISVGTDADIKGKTFDNQADMTVGKNLVAELKEFFKSKRLTVGNNLDVKAKQAEISEKLEVGNDATFDSRHVIFGTDKTVKDDDTKENNDVNIVGNLTVKNGGLENNFTTAVGKNLDIDKGDGEGTVTNTKVLNVGENTTIKTDKFDNSGVLYTKNNFTGTVKDTFDNSGTLQVGEKLTAEAGELTNKKGGKILANEINIKSSGNVTNEEGASIESKIGTSIEAAKLDNSGDILSEAKLNADVQHFLNNASGNFKAENIEIIISKEFLNKNKNATESKDAGKKVVYDGIVGGTISIVAKDDSGKEINFDNNGNIISVGTYEGDKLVENTGKLTIDMKKNNVDINLDNDGKVSSVNTMRINTGGNINNSTDISNMGALDFSAGKNIVNTAMLVSLNDIVLKAQGNVHNKGKNNSQGSSELGGSDKIELEGVTIWSGGDIVIEAIGQLINEYAGTIESKETMTITADEIINRASTIRSGAAMTLKADKITNESLSTLKLGAYNKDKDINGGNDPSKNGSDQSGEVNNKDGATALKYNLILNIPVYKIDGEIKNSEISAGGDVTITGKNGDNSTDLTNTSSTIQTSGNLDIKGNVINQSDKNLILTLEKYFENIEIVGFMYHSTAAGAPSGNIHVTDKEENDITYTQRSLMRLLEDFNSLSDDDVRGLYNCLKAIAPQDTELGQALNLYFGPGWEQQGDGIKFRDALKKGTFKEDLQGEKYFYKAGSNGQILAKGNIKLHGGKINNGTGATSQENAEVSVTIAGKDVTADRGTLGVEIQNPNDIEELDGIKPVHKVEVQTGQVTINGVTIDGSTGGVITDIAVAGTINPIIYIEIPKGDNGIFKPATPQANGRVPYKYETNIEFIDLSKYYGSNYFFDKIGVDKDKVTTVIGDSYYEKQLIDKTIKQSLGYAGEITNDNVKSLLDNGAEVSKDLGLTLGVPLTPEQINNLEKDIIWYVEMEVDGDVVLVPQVYFGKDTRLKLAESDKGEGAGSTIKAGGNIDIDADNLVNSNANIVGGGNVSIKSENDIINNATGGFTGGIAGGGDVSLDAKNDITMNGGTVKGDSDVSLKAGNDITINSGVGYDENGNQYINNTAGVQGKGDINIESGGDTTIKGGVVESTDKGNVNISGENVNIEDKNLISTESKAEGDLFNNSSYQSISSKSSGSTVAGENVNINAKNDINIKGSDVVAGDTTNLEAGKDVNITDAQEYKQTKSSSTSVGFENGLLNVKVSNTETSSSTSKGSTVGGVGGLNIKSGGNTTIKGSDAIAGEKGINIKSGGDVNIIDGQDTFEGKSSSVDFNTISVNVNNTEVKSTTSKGSSLSSMGGINIEAGGNVKSVGSEMNALGDTNINAGGDVKFEAGKNTYQENSSNISIGVTSASASAGIAGYGASAEWTPSGGGSTNIYNGEAVEQSKNAQNKGAKSSGKVIMDSLASAQTTVGVSINNSSTNSTTWTEGEINTGGDLNIKSGGTTDIGGADFATGGDFNITAKDIDSTKYEDKTQTSTEGISVGIKVSNNTTSAIVDAVNKGSQIAENAQNGDLNGALTGTQIAGSVSNIIFGDLAANVTSVSGEIGYNKGKTSTSTENTTNISSGGNINFKSTEGDINLKGVEMDGKDVTLDAAKDVNITDAKSTEKEDSFGFSISGGVNVAGGASMLDGGYAGGGIHGSASFNQNLTNNQYGSGSSITGENVTIKSGGDTNVIGSNVTGDNVNLDVKGNLNVETKKDQIDQSRTEAWAGFDVSAGVASNTIVTGDAGLSAGGGQIYQKGDKVENQAGITAKNNIDANVGGDLNVKGGILGSETGEGNLNVGGNINVEDVKSNYEENGAIAGANVGSKGGGIQGEVGDVVDQEKTAKGTIGLGNGNVTVGGDVTVNGTVTENVNRNDNPLEGVNTDINNSLTTDKDVYQGGGTFSGTAQKVNKPSKKGSYDIDTPDGPINKGSSYETGSVENKPTIPEVDYLPKPDKGTISGGETESGGNKIPDLVLPETTPKVDLPVPDFPDNNGGNTNKGNNGDGDVDVPKPNKPTDGDTNNSGTNKPINNGGYVKDPETGKWVKPNIDGGAILTGGAITNKNALDGFKKGLESLNGTLTKNNTGDSGSNTVTKPPVTEGQYVKNPETGKWEPANGSQGKPGAITTNGPFGSKGSLDGFQKGAESLNGNKSSSTGTSDNSNTVTKPPVTEGQYTKNPETGKWEPSKGNNNGGAIKGDVVTDVKTPEKPTISDVNTAQKDTAEVVTPETNGSNKNDSVSNGGYTKDPETGKWTPDGGDQGIPGAITTNGPFGSKGSLDGFQKGAESLNGNKSSSTGTSDNSNTVTKPPVTEGQYTKNPETGKWEPSKGNNNGGAIKGDVVTDVKTPEKPTISDVNTAQKDTAEVVTPETNGSNKNDSVTNGGYTKDPETGKWTPDGGDQGIPGAITTNGPFGSKGSLDGFQKGAESLKKNNSGETSETPSSGDKYGVLDKENAFDFPTDDGTRVEINDTANEKVIVPETYTPLDAVPPKYDTDTNTGRENLEVQLGNLLDKQKEIADKPTLTENDKKQLEAIEKQLSEITKQLNSDNGGIEYPPVDYDDNNGGIEYPPVDYDDNNGGIEYPPVDYDDDGSASGNTGKIPTLPEPDYKPNKKVNFNDEVEVKYIDNNSTKPVGGDKENLNDVTIKK